jgi:hypothetical protein
MCSDMVVQAIQSLGGATSVARLRGRTPWAISKWMRNGIPAGEVLWLSEQTGWRFTPHQLSPALYPNATDGMPRRSSTTPEQRAA